jgi:hypothetical protein
MYNTSMSIAQIERNTQIAQAVAMGIPQAKIAATHDIDQSRVSQIANTNESKALIESVRAQVVTRCAQNAVDNMVGFIQSTDPTDKPFKYKASEKVLESIGALASHTQAAMVLNIYQQNNEIHLDQAASTALDHLGIDKLAAIDVEE